MRLLNVSGKSYHIDTIASWALRLSLSYSGKSGWRDQRPANDEQWNALYDACTRLLDQGFIRRIVKASYDGVYVDEYQDCSVAQHAIVVKLARDLPSRILGDPLQGIFDFGQENPVHWRRDVEDNFVRLGGLEVPHRWIQVGANRLGAWLNDVRQYLEQGQPIDLRVNRPNTVRVVETSADHQVLLQSQGNTCRYFTCDRTQSVIAIHKGSQEYKAKCHNLSRNLSGRFSSIEEVEGKRLFSFVQEMERAQTNAARLRGGIEFAKACMTAVGQNLPAGTARGEHVAIRTKTRNPEAARSANEYLVEPTSKNLAAFLLAVKGIEGVRVFRADLFNRALGVLGKHASHPNLSLAESAERYHGEFRHMGRPIRRRRLIGTTLLVKGLEFDHAIVLDATSLSKKELYVALTRGARSLTIVTTKPVLNPAD